jgi:hypothetical protein
MVLSYDYSNRNRRRRRTNAPLSLAISIAMAVRWCDTARIAQWRRSRALIKATKCHHRATTRSVLPRRPPGRQQTLRRCNMYPLCWPFWWLWRCDGTIPSISPDGGGSWLSQKPLNAIIWWALAPILQNRTCQRRLIPTFHREKGLELTC